MQCENCGRPLRPEERICPNCGEPVLRDLPYDAETVASVPSFPTERRAPVGAPADPYTPTIYGPPVGPDRYASVSAPPSDAPPRRYIGGYRPLQPLVPSRVRRRSGCLRGVAALSALVVLIALFVGALAATGQRIAGVDLGFFRTRPTATAVVPTHIPAPVCPASQVDPQAARMLDRPQLSTGVRNLQGHDLHPIDVTNHFLVGQYFFVTFQIATNAAGTVGTAFCLNGHLITYTLNVANNMQYWVAVYPDKVLPSGQAVPVALTSEDAGPGVVTVTWNGAVAAVLRFTVTTH